MNYVRVQIKRANQKDIPGLISIEKSVAGTKTFSPMLTETEWGEALRTDKVFLIEKGGMAIGNMSYRQSGAGEIYLSGLVIRPESQNKGMGREAMVLLMEEIGKVKRIELAVHPLNREAIGLYKSLGFKKKNVVENYYGDGEPRLILVLQN